MVNKKDIGRRVRRHRQTMNPAMTINKLALIAEVDSGQLSRAERGLSGLSLDALGRVAQALHISLATLLTDKQPTAKVSRVTSNREELVGELTQIVWQSVHLKASKYSRSEKELITHQIQSAIEEGVLKAEVYSERSANHLRALKKSKT